MKKFSEFIDNLTLKQAQKYSLLNGFLFGLLCFALFLIILWSIIDIALIIMTFLYSVLFGIAACFLSNQLIFDVNAKKIKQELISKYNLTNTSYTEVTYIPDSLLLDAIIKTCDCKIYAKFANTNGIELIIKDKAENIIYNQKIDNLIYFRNHFEIK